VTSGLLGNGSTGKNTASGLSLCSGAVLWRNLDHVRRAAFQ
jgi:hypothetical protein